MGVQLALQFMEEGESVPEAPMWKELGDEQRIVAMEALIEMMAKMLEEEMGDE
jgi:hypothetical protein